MLLRGDGAALLQHRDDKPGLNHANLWVPPGGHAEPGEAIEACAWREFEEETDYACEDLRFLSRFEDRVGDQLMQLTMFWDRWDGVRQPVCREGQALEFVRRNDFAGREIPAYLVKVWDDALVAARAAR